MEVLSLFRERRLNELLRYITVHDEASVAELVNHFSVSAMTVRRDLAMLEQAGQISRTHGGAVALHVLDGEEIYENKLARNYDVKQRIAQKAFSLIQSLPEGHAPPQSIFLDSGTTTYQIALLMKKLIGIYLFTNDVRIAAEIYRYPLNAFMVGGRIQPETSCVCGPPCNAYVDSLNFELCVIGVSAVNPKLMLSSPSEEKAYSKQNVMKHSRIKILVCDKSKFNRIALFNVTSITAFDYVITDYEFTHAQQKQLSEGKVVVLHV